MSEGESPRNTAQNVRPVKADGGAVRQDFGFAGVRA